MSNKVKKFRKVLLYICLAFTILSICRFFTNDVGKENPMESLIQTYNIGEKLSESATLALLSNDNVVSVIKDKDTYILKTEDNKYYQTNNTEAISMGIELSGLTEMQDVSPKPTISFFDIFIGVLLLISIGLCVFSMIMNYLKQKVYSNLNEMSFMPLQTEENDMIYTKEKDIKEETMDGKKITFDDIQGIDELKPDLYRLVDCLSNPDKYTSMGARMPKGVILYGPPGTGKTLTAKALAGESGVPFLSMCGSDFMEKYVGVGASRIRELYKKARKIAPCIVFIDEIDAIGGGRGEFNSSEKDQTINALLAELDGFKSADNILTICATNRLDILDSALLRAGRFDLKLAIGLPDLEGREAILKLHSKNKKLSENVILREIAKTTMGFSGAELENLLNEAALIAANSEKECIDREDIENAFFKVVMDGNKKKRKKGDSNVELTAYHEAGHTLVSKLLVNESVPYVTITPSTSGADGVTFIASDEKSIPSKKYLRNRIKMAYAGRAAEELFMGNTDDITTGASEDIKNATNILKGYIGSYGMGEMGLLDIKQLTSQYNILEEATKLSNLLYKETVDFLRENYTKLDSLAKVLLEKETVYEDEINVLFDIVVKEEVGI